MTFAQEHSILPTIKQLKRKYGKNYIDEFLPNRNIGWRLPSPTVHAEQNSNIFLSSKRLMQPGAVIEEIESIKHRIRHIDEQRDQQLYIEIARAFDLAEFLEANETAWVEYCRDRKWQKIDERSRPKFGQSSEALRIVVADLCLDVQDPGKRKRRLNLYFSALRELKARNVAPRDACDEIRQTPKGLSGLRTAWASRMLELRTRRTVVDRSAESDKAPSAEAPPKRGAALKKEAQPSNTAKKSDDSRRYANVLVRKNKCFRTLMRGNSSSSSVRITKVTEGDMMFRLDF